MAGGCEYVYYQFKNIFDFVKDKENLLSYNVWAAGDYNKNTNNFNTWNGVISASKEWSSNGEYSIKFTQSTATPWAGMDTRVSINSCSVEFTCDILTNCKILVMLYKSQPTTGTIQSVELNETSESIPVKITCTLPSDTTQLSMRVLQQYGSTENITYLDNLSLKIQ